MVKLKFENETKEEKFRRIASSRTQKVIDTLNSLGKCSNRAIYSYTESEIKKVFNAIEKELKRVKDMFEDRKNVKFRL